MREADLRRVLFVKAFEEADMGALAPADRAAAAREARRQVPLAAPLQLPLRSHGHVSLPPEAERLLALRAAPLVERIRARHPAVAGALASASRFAPVDVVLVIAGLLAGFALSALDGTQRIQVLSLSLAALLSWNAVVYLLLAVQALRARGKPREPGALRLALARFPASVVSRIVARSRAFDVALAEALRRFVRDWFEAAAPLYGARAARAIHLGAAAIGVGLVAGLYLRGTVLDYQASWESTFLDGHRVRAIAGFLYGPASWLSGIQLPDAAHLEAIRWRDGTGGEPAARWIHLIAITVLLWVVVPRLVLAGAASARAAMIARRMPLPDFLASHVREAFASVEGVIERPVAVVLPYAYSPGAGTLARLLAWVPSVTSPDALVDAADPVPYGEEDRFVEALAQRGADRAGFVVLPFSLATTPEDENHGAVIEAVRDRLAGRGGARLVVVVDEAPYEARMAAAPERIAERRELWRRFLEARGLEAHFAKLAA